MLSKPLICSAILLATSASVDAQSNAELHRLATVAKPIEQAVTFNLDPSKERFSGHTTIKLEVLKATQFIELNGLDYAINTAELVGKASCELRDKMLETGKVRLSCEKTLQPGRYTLTIDYTAPYNRNSVGLYKTIDNGVPYLFTQFQMSDARRAIPTFDEPEYKIPFQLTITAPDNQKVFANTPVLEIKKSNGMTTHYFDKTPPLPSYLVALSVGPFEVLDVKGMSVPGNIITPQKKSNLAAYSIENTPKILKALEDYFDLPYVYKKLDQVAVPEFPFGAMENAGLVTYREDILLIDPATSTRQAQTSHVNVIAHELAHQWYGNLVTMKWWNDLWLNEAFATWMAAKITLQLFPELETNLSLSQHRAMPYDAQATTSPIRKPVITESDVTDGLGLAYSKGSAVLYMVEQWLGEAVFKQGMRNYIRKFAYKNAEAKDLWNELSKVSNKDVATVLDSFVSQASFPLLTIKLNGQNATVSQQRFVIKGQEAAAQTWHIPITLRYGKGDKTATKTILLDSKTQQIKLDFEPEWILPNDNATGYYRWDLSESQLASLISHAPNKLNERERLDLLSNVDALMESGKINANALMLTLSEFINDTHPKVAKAALTQLLSQHKQYEDDSNKLLWKKLYTTYVEPAFSRYGLKANANEPAATSEIRAALVRALAFETKHQTIITHAKKQASLYLTSPDKVDPYLARSFLQIAAYYGDAELLKSYKKVFETTNNPTQRTNLLLAMGYFGPQELQQQVLDYALSEHVTASDFNYILSGNGKGDERKALYQKWFYQHFERLKERFPPFAKPQLPFYLFSYCDADALKQAQQFFGPMQTEIEGLSKSLKQLELATNTCIMQKQRELASVNQFLNNL
ncbi:M1 family metallopeptidase [Pseudoalteromonas piscicida]